VSEWYRLEVVLSVLFEMEDVSSAALMWGELERLEEEGGCALKGGQDAVAAQSRLTTLLLWQQGSVQGVDEEERRCW
jgi:hypothetical protein